MERFIYKKAVGITALSASFTDFKYKKHTHKEYAIGVTLRGIQEYNLAGSHQFSCQNGVMLFNPEQPHDGMAHDETGIDYVMLYIDPKLLLEISEKKDIVRFSSPVVYNYLLRQRILNLSYEILSGSDEALCSELLLSLVDTLTESDLFMYYRKENNMVKKVKERIHSNLGNVLKLDENSSELGLSKFQLIRMFKANVGISPYQYFLNCKVERAKQLIEKDKDVYSAVAECGFVDLTHLNKYFKRIYGITAFEYKSCIS